MATLTRPDLFPVSKKVKVFALPYPLAGEFIKNNTPQQIRTCQATLSSTTLTCTEGEQNLAAGVKLAATGITAGAEIVKKLAKAGDWEVSSSMTTEATAETVVIYPAGQAITTYNPENWKPALTKLAEPEANATGEITLDEVGQDGVLVAAEVAGVGWTYLVEMNETATAQRASATKTAGKVKVKTTSTSVVGENVDRNGLQLVNTGTVAMYLQLGAAAVEAEGIYLAKEGGSWNGMVGVDVWTGSVFGIASSESTVTVVEV